MLVDLKAGAWFLTGSSGNREVTAVVSLGSVSEPENVPGREPQKHIQFLAAAQIKHVWL